MNRRARQNKSPKTSGLEVVIQGTNLGQRIVQPIFPLSSSFDNSVFNCIKTVQKTNLTSSTIATTFGSFNFTLSDVNDAASLASVFDQYRIKMVEVLFIPGQNAQTSATGATGIFTSVIDYDDDNVLTSAPQAMDYSSAITTSGYEEQRRVFKPHVALAVYNGAFTGYANQADQWLDCADTGVRHYGVKTSWTGTPAVSVISVIAKYHLQFRNIR